MNVGQGIFIIRRILSNSELEDSEKLKRIAIFLPDENSYKFYSMKDHILDCAKKSTSKKFRLLASMNDPIIIFNWCNEEHNFIGMNHIAGDKIYKIEYTLDELPEVIDNAEKWLKSTNENSHVSGRRIPYFISSLQLSGC